MVEGSKPEPDREPEPSSEVKELCRLLARILRRADNLPKGDTPENEPDEEFLESE